MKTCFYGTYTPQSTIKEQQSQVLIKGHHLQNAASARQCTAGVCSYA